MTFTQHSLHHHTWFVRSISAWVLCWAAFTGTTGSAWAADAAKLAINPLYILVSDAIDANKEGQSIQAQAALTQLQHSFEALKAKESVMGQRVGQALQTALANPSTEHLTQLTQALRNFELEQNPIDYSAKRADFKRKITPALKQLQAAIDESSVGNSQGLIQANQLFNSAWVGSERVVRNTSLGHYGAIETAMALMRVAIETEPVDLNKVRQHAATLQEVIDSYNSGQTMAANTNTVSFSDGLRLLRDGLNALESQELAQGQGYLTRFIEIWPGIEGEVSTRNPDLYTRIESQIPVILAHGAQPDKQAQLQVLINEMAEINPQAEYSFIDAMLILLREGLEALLIVMALFSALHAAQQEKGKRWINAGVGAGLVASVLGALALQQLFPAATAGNNREMIEGFVGIVTVAMMLMVGAWLHSKSSLYAWNQYIKKHMGQALTTGSLISLFGLSFLSVFREGAETIIFYAGIMPRISTYNFLLGIALALLILAVVALVLFRTSYRLPIAKMFKLLTWVIYALGFKILGVSVHALQLTGYLPMTSLSSQWLQVPDLGLFATTETLAVQALYVGVIVVLQMLTSRQLKPVQTASAL